MPVSPSDPLLTLESSAQEWAEAARRLIAERAARRATSVTWTYGELYATLKALGLDHKKVAVPVRDWMSEVLYSLALINTAYHEPLMTSMVVRQDTGEVGEGYAVAMRHRYGIVSPKRLADHAAVERLKVIASVR